MLGEPTESPRSSPPHRDAEGRRPENSSERARAADEHKRPGERFGPLTLTRRVKDDGRALILYERVPEERS
jgi:hypothetical protein